MAMPCRLALSLSHSSSPAGGHFTPIRISFLFLLSGKAIVHSESRVADLVFSFALFFYGGFFGRHSEWA